MRELARLVIGLYLAALACELALVLLDAYDDVTARLDRLEAGGPTSIESETHGD